MKTLLFDMDDTLLVEEASAQAAFYATCKYANKICRVNPELLYTQIRESCRFFWHNSPAREYCLEVGISSWEGLWAKFNGDSEHLHVLSEWAPFYRKNSWEEALRRCGCEKSKTIAEELGEKYIQERRKRHVVFDDVLPTLNYFKPRCKLGILTNGSPDLQRAKLEGSGIADLFDAVVISGELGFGKPDFRIFEIALERLDASKESAVMVGNSLKSDIAPALQIGIMAVWVNRESKPRNKPIIPDAEIANLLELKKICKDL